VGVPARHSACLHRNAPPAKELVRRAGRVGNRFGTQAWQESLLIRRDAFRPPHPLTKLASLP